MALTGPNLPARELGGPGLWRLLFLRAPGAAGFGPAREGYSRTTVLLAVFCAALQ